MAAHSTALVTPLLFLAAAVVIVTVFKRLQLSPVLGYLVAGAAIGPFGFAVVQEAESATSLAQVGVVFLLFLIGLEMSWARLKSLRRYVLGMGSLQILLTMLVIGLLANMMGLSHEAAVVVGGGLALSSTALVMQILEERREQSNQVGRLSLAMLLSQDFAVIPLLVLVPLLAEGEGSLLASMGTAILRALITMTVIVVLGRVLLRPMFKAIASVQSEELFTAATLLLVLGTAYATEHFGLSAALGAFLAGLLMAETEFAHQIEANVQPFKQLLMGLFFMTVGMAMNWQFVLEHAPKVMSITLGLILLKAFIIFVVARAFKVPLGVALRTGLLMAQGSEFGFVLFKLAIGEGVLPMEAGELLMVAVSVSMAVTPLLEISGRKLAKLAEHRGPTDFHHAPSETQDISDHVVVCGFGRVGQTVARLLREERIPFVALDMDARLVATHRADGVPVYYGDSSRREVLEAVGLIRARAVIVTVDEILDAKRTVASIRQSASDIPVIVRARDKVQVHKLHDAGADMVVPEAFESSLQIGAHLLRSLGTADHEINRVLNEFRAEQFEETKREWLAGRKG